MVLLPAFTTKQAYKKAYSIVRSAYDEYGYFNIAEETVAELVQLPSDVVGNALKSYAMSLSVFEDLPFVNRHWRLIWRTSDGRYEKYEPETYPDHIPF